MKLSDDLKNLTRYPFHMPGHKRNPKFEIAGAEIDITEIDGYDNLHSPTDSIKAVEDSLADIYKSKKSYMLVNGSTVGILSAIYAVCDRGDKIIIARNCHKSVYNACMLLELRVVYLEPEYDYINGYYSRVNQFSLDELLLKNKDACAVVITSPTYEGNISNVKCKIPLIIDAAHGAHLGLGVFPSYPSGDIVVSSLHKTLPALTQTAVVNVYNEKYIDAVKHYLDIFETSSPSYVLMNSVAVCCDFIKGDRTAFGDFYNGMYEFRDLNLHALKIKYTDDISKLVVSTANTDLSGADLAEALRNDYNLEPEMVSKNYVILMATVADTAEMLDKLKRALIEVDADLLQSHEDILLKPSIPSGEQIISISKNAKEVSFKKSSGCTANEFVYAYPPDIPIIVPGETVTQKNIDFISAMLNHGVNIISDSGLIPNKLLTKEDI